MFYRKNVGTRERWTRAVAGGLMVACALLGIGMTPLGLLMGGAGVFTALTGVVGFCPACAMVGRKPLEGSK
jgi:hypothetical protein